MLASIKLRLAFMGSPDFAVPALVALHGTGHEIGAVYCQPPRPAGRGHDLRCCPVHATAERLRLPVRTPVRLRTDPAAQAEFAQLDLDAAVVAAYGLILPPAMLSAPRRGCINIHASLLPRWRGAAPIHAAVLAGDTETGVTIMQMDAGLDTGPVLLAEAVPIPPRATTGLIHDVLVDLGARLVLRALAENPEPRPQPQHGATYAPKLTKEDGRLNWTEPAEALDRRVRAMGPWPGAFTMWQEGLLKVLSAEPTGGAGRPGELLDGSLRVACGAGALQLRRVQLAGGKALDAAEFLRGHPIPVGSTLGT
jgi:methionyl-tRNA formyltransferase